MLQQNNKTLKKHIFRDKNRKYISET